MLGIYTKNPKIAFSSNVNKDSRILINRNITERAKTVLPGIIYDEEPYQVITDEGKTVWVLERIHNITKLSIFSNSTNRSKWKQTKNKLH